MSDLGWLSQPAVLPWVALSLGLCVGSFLNVVIHRLPRMLEAGWRAECAELEGRKPPAAEKFNLLVPRSFCPNCRHRIKTLENIPVISWIYLGGKCSHCKSRIGVRYPLVEAAAGIVGAYAAWRWGFTLAALGAMLFCWAMIALAAIDLDTQLLPDDITLPLLWAGLLINLGGVLARPGDAIIGAAAGYLLLWLVYWAFKLATGKEGMGYGDFKLLAAIGAWLGWQQLPLVVLLAATAGAVVGVALMAFARHRRDQPIPFGPYLAAAGLVALFWGGELTRRWLPLLA